MKYTRQYFSFARAAATASAIRRAKAKSYLNSLRAKHCPHFHCVKKKSSRASVILVAVVDNALVGELDDTVSPAVVFAPVVVVAVSKEESKFVLDNSDIIQFSFSANLVDESDISLIINEIN